MKNLVSIIIPTFNRAHLIGETLDSVLAQTYQNWECIVVDDGSVDDTAEVMAAYMAKDSRFQYHHRPKDRLPGGNAARNYGFELSRGEYIQWFDSDDIMLDAYLEKKIEVFNKGADTDVVFCAYGYFDNNSLQKRISNNIFGGNILEDLIDKDISFSPLSYLLKREILYEYSFDEKIVKAQDADFFFRVFTSSKYLKVAHCPEVLYYVRKHQEAISTSLDSAGSMIKSRYMVFERFLKYFIATGHIKGISKYKRQCLIELKTMLNNKNYKMLIQIIIDSEYLNVKQKSYLLFCVFSEYVFGRGGEQFKKMKI